MEPINLFFTTYLVLGFAYFLFAQFMKQRSQMEMQEETSKNPKLSHVASNLHHNRANVDHWMGTLLSSTLFWLIVSFVNLVLPRLLKEKY